MTPNCSQYLMQTIEGCISHMYQIWLKSEFRLRIISRYVLTDIQNKNTFIYTQYKPSRTPDSSEKLLQANKDYFLSNYQISLNSVN